MKIFQGKGVFPGVAFGEMMLLLKHNDPVDDGGAEDPAAEWERYLAAKAETDAQLEALYNKTRAEIGEEEANIIDVQRLMLEDGDFGDSVEKMIWEDGKTAAYAASATGKRFAAFFASLDDPYMKARATDVGDVSRRLVDVLLGRGQGIRFERPTVIVADDLTPSETLQMDKTLIRAFVMRGGSTNSHTAILSRTMNIPCIVQADIPLDPALNGRPAGVDGGTGLCYLEPDVPTAIELEAKQQEERARRELLEQMRGKPTVTKDGHAVRIFANIGGPGDLPAVVESDAEGIGLLRTEFLYLGRGDYPGEQEQFEAYKKVAEATRGKPVVIRTLDIGADKKVAYFGLEQEENPALGLRGVRICIERPELFKTQLRAIYRASAFGNVAVMFPMITSLWEVRRCKELAAEARSELTAEGYRIGDVELGIMVETPAAAVIADALAKEVDFFSVGTNDLIQYTLAVDRQNSRLERFYDPRHPAILKMLAEVASAARKSGIWAGICGELAADLTLTGRFLEMGFDELSVSPTFVLGLRKQICDMDLQEVLAKEPL